MGGNWKAKGGPADGSYSDAKITGQGSWMIPKIKGDDSYVQGKWHNGVWKSGEWKGGKWIEWDGKV